MLRETELVGRSSLDIVRPDDREGLSKLFRSLIAGDRESFRRDVRFETPEGSDKWGRVSLSTVRGEAGEILYLVALVEDIDARKQAESRLGDLQSRYVGLFQNSYQMTAILDEVGRLIDANETIIKEFGLPSDLDGLIGEELSSMDWVGPVVSLRLQEMVDECLSTGRTIRQTLSAAETETHRALDITIKPVTDSLGHIRYSILEAHDVTEILELTNRSGTAG